MSDIGPAAGADAVGAGERRRRGLPGDHAALLPLDRRSTSDTAEGDAVEGLVASGTSSVSTDLTAPSTPGTYYYGACGTP